jgi:hypothetical protein
VPPLADLFVVDLGVDDVGEWDLEAASKCPELVEALDLKYRYVAVDRHVDHER